MSVDTVESLFSISICDNLPYLFSTFLLIVLVARAIM